MFVEQLQDYTKYERRWPEHRTLSTFYKWFHVNCHTLVFDLAGTEII